MPAGQNELLFVHMRVPQCVNQVKRGLHTAKDEACINNEVFKALALINGRADWLIL